MKKLAFIALALLVSCTLSVTAGDYKASLFGIKSDGVTLNTRSIQKAIDMISEEGGGTLDFYVGRYLTGTIFLKSNVTIRLNEGAVLVGVTAAYDYFGGVGSKALIVGENLNNVSIIGKGVLQGQGAAIAENIQVQIDKGNLTESMAQASPRLIMLSDCNDVTIDGIVLQEACGDSQEYKNCKNVKINNITVEAKSTPGSKGMVFSGCENFSVSNTYFDTNGVAVSSAQNSTGVSFTESKTPNGKKVTFTK